MGNNVVKTETDLETDIIGKAVQKNFNDQYAEVGSTTECAQDATIDVNNITLRGRPCHTKYDLLNIHKSKIQ